MEKDLRVCRTILDRTCGFLTGDCWAFVRRLKSRNRRELRIGGSSAATRTGRIRPSRRRKVSHALTIRLARTSVKARQLRTNLCNPPEGRSRRKRNQAVVAVPISLWESVSRKTHLRRTPPKARPKNIHTVAAVQQEEEAQHEHAHTINQNAKGPGKGAFSVGARHRLLEAGARLLASDGTSRR